MYNVKARFEGKMIESDEQFIGNLDSGAIGQIDAIVTAKEETMDNTECKLILTYEDDAGNVSTAEGENLTLLLCRCQMPETWTLWQIYRKNRGLPIGMILAAAVVVDRCCGCGNRAYMKRKAKNVWKRKRREVV